MSLAPDQQQQRYAAIELAYSERRWLDVEQLSRALLGELSDEPQDPLRLRVVLLLGHTRLYGFGDGRQARTHYVSVLQHSDEATLREIAEQGLDQCTLLAEPTVDPPLQPNAEQPADAAAPTPGAATPWLKNLEQTDGPVRSAAGQPGGSADASPWLMAVSDAATPRPLEQQQGDFTRQAAGLEAEPAVTAEAREATVTSEATETHKAAEGYEAVYAAVEVIDEPEQVEVALALSQQEPLDLGNGTPVLEQPGDLLRPDPEPAEAEPETAATPEAPDPGESEDLRQGLLRLKLG